MMGGALSRACQRGENSDSANRGIQSQCRSQTMNEWLQTDSVVNEM